MLPPKGVPNGERVAFSGFEGMVRWRKEHVVVRPRSSTVRTGLPCVPLMRSLVPWLKPGACVLRSPGGPCLPPLLPTYAAG